MTLPGWSETVQFEIADMAAAVRLSRSIGRTWDVGLLVEGDEVRPDETNVVVAELRDCGDDLALLLREVEAWVEQESLLAIRFLVDGRTYVLEAGKADWESTPWTPAEADPRIAPTG
jgi:hypothetical protein